VRERMRRDTVTQLEIRDEEQLYRAMSRGELEAKEQHARRVYAAAPKDVSAELKTTALAEVDQRQAAVEAEAQGDEATAKALHSLGDLLGTQKAALEADHAEYEDWSAQTAGLREEGGKPAPSSPAAVRRPKPGPARRRLNGGSVSSATARPSNSTSSTWEHKSKRKAARGPRSRPQSTKSRPRLSRATSPTWTPLGARESVTSPATSRNRNPTCPRQPLRSRRPGPCQAPVWPHGALTWRDTRSATMIAFALVPAASTSIFPAITPEVVATCSSVNPAPRSLGDERKFPSGVPGCTSPPFLPVIYVPRFMPIEAARPVSCRGSRHAGHGGC
jgi:hypothetical protein